MDRQKPVVGEHEHDHLKHVPGLIRPDGELLRRVAVIPEGALNVKASDEVGVDFFKRGDDDSILARTR